MTKEQIEKEIMTLWKKHHYLKNIDKVGYIKLFEDFREVLIRLTK